jgi:hypothetical protein
MSILKTRDEARYASSGGDGMERVYTSFHEDEMILIR